MRHDCPYCQQSIKWKLVRSKPLPGERKVLPNQAVPVCPLCGGELAANTHWSELLAGAIVALPLLLFLSLRSAITTALALYLGAGVLLFWAAAFVFLHLRFWRHWQRYKKYVPSQRWHLQAARTRDAGPEGHAMTEPVARCEACGAVLPTPDAVCPRCEQELASAAANPASGRYRCPACSSRFDRASLAWYPPDAPWYWPQRQENQCPHCQSFLRDRKAARFSRTEYAILVALVVAAQFSPWRPGTQIGLLLAIVVFQYLRWRRAQSCVPVEEERYALQEPGR